jgi:two-component system response regulator HydG
VASAGRFWPKLKIIATTAEDPELLAQRGRLKADLALLLPLNSIFVPPLRERKGDLALLAAHFLEEDFAPDRICYFSEDAMVALLAYDWPGNVSELKKIVSELAGRVKGVTFKAKDLPNALLEKGFYVQDVTDEDLAELNYNQAKNLALNKFNREYISILLSRSNNNLTVAAEIAGMDRSNFKKIVKKYFPEI